MKIKQFFALMCLMSFALAATAADQEIIVSLKMSPVETGPIVISLYDSADTFLKNPLHEITITLTNDDGTDREFSLGKFPPGSYAIAAYHDKNSNGKLDRNIFRIPKEKIGISNNVQPKFGPPKWSDANFSVTNTDQRIELQLGKLEQ